MKSKDKTAMLKMKDLSQITGVNKSTITYYLNEGLLLEPLRTKRNVAYYDPACAERINFIKELQAKHRLPLAAIKKALDLRDKGHDIMPYVELEEILVGWTDSQRLNKRQFCDATGLSPKILDECINKRILLPLEKGVFDTEDVAIGRQLCMIIKLGLDVRDASFYPKYGEKIVKEELKLRDRIITSLSYEESGVTTLEMTKAARSFRAYIIDRLFRHAIIKRRHNMIKKKDTQISGPEHRIQLTLRRN